MSKIGKQTARSKKGASAIEYGLLVGLASIVSILTLGQVGTQVADAFCSSSTIVKKTGPLQDTPRNCVTEVNLENTPVLSPSTPGENIEENGILPPQTPPAYTPSSQDLVLVFDGDAVVYLKAAAGETAQIEWGDGTTQSVDTTARQYAKIQSGLNEVRISGKIDTFGHFGTKMTNLIEVKSFGTMPLVSLNGTFSDIDKLERVASLPPSIKSFDLTFSGNDSKLEGFQLLPLDLLFSSLILL